MEDNETRAALARYRRNIEISGKAMIVFAIWSVGKILLPVLFGQQSMKAALGITRPDQEEDLLLIVITEIIVLAALLIFYARLGGGAILYAAGRRDKKGFLVRAVILLIVTIAGLPLYFLMPVLDSANDTVVTALLLDLTTVLALCDMIYSTVRVEKIRKRDRTE